MPELVGSSEYGALRAAVREPREPSMKPLSMVVWRKWIALRMGGLMLFEGGDGRSKASHSLTRRWSFPERFEVFEDEEVFPVGEILD